jgi:hypothetical protein
MDYQMKMKVFLACVQQKQRTANGVKETCFKASHAAHADALRMEMWKSIAGVVS